ncbi:MAG: hypothetical protein L0Y57_12390 [Beijerinckiaceae bacterium]|nr:hypothetical protein [Beijerinckiaceae bacterium]
MSELTLRTASLSDLKELWGLIRDVAVSIPFPLESEAAQESVLSELMACCTSGLSPVAVSGNKDVVGVLLVRRDTFEWGFRNSKAVHIAYAAVAPAGQDQGVLAALLAKVQEQKVPILASVKNGNQIGLTEELAKHGFAHECTAESGWGDLYKWQPVPVTH